MTETDLPTTNNKAFQLVRSLTITAFKATLPGYDRKRKKKDESKQKLKRKKTESSIMEKKNLKVSQLSFI